MNALKSFFRCALLAAMLPLIGCATTAIDPYHDLREQNRRQQAAIEQLHRRIEELEARLHGVRFKVTPNLIQTLPMSGFGE